MAKKKPLYMRANPTKQLLLALALFAVATLMSRDDSLSNWEAELFRFVYDLPDFFYPFFYLVTQTGSIYMLGTLLIFYGLKRHYHVLLRLLMTGTLAYLLAGQAKSLWGRARPHELLPDIIALDVFQGPGFPSGHVALATALAFTIGHYLPRRYHWLPVAWIVGVALSRMFLGVHVPLDILGGFALGWIAYALFRHVRIYDVAPLKK